MKLLIEVAADFKAGECYDYTNGPACPFAGRGCWAGAKGAEKCPLKEALEVVAVDDGSRVEQESTNTRVDGEVVKLYCTKPEGI